MVNVDYLLNVFFTLKNSYYVLISVIFYLWQVYFHIFNQFHTQLLL